MELLASQIIGNYDADYGRIPISDEQISAAQHFENWSRSYHTWPLICEDYDKEVEHQAYHIRYLASAMLLEGGWIGPPLLLSKAGAILDGSHRLRAVAYLRPLIEIKVPIKWHRYE